MAKAVEQLIAYGHSPDAVWNYTPRQIHAWLELASKRRKRELREQFSVATVAARGDESQVKKTLRDLDDE